MLREREHRRRRGNPQSKPVKPTANLANVRIIRPQAGETPPEARIGLTQLAHLIVEEIRITESEIETAFSGSAANLVRQGEET